LLQRALDGLENILGVEHDMTLRTVRSLGQVYADFESDSE